MKLLQAHFKHYDLLINSILTFQLDPMYNTVNLLMKQIRLSYLGSLVWQGRGLRDLAFVEHFSKFLRVLTADVDLFMKTKTLE